MSENSPDFRTDPRFFRWAFGCDMNCRIFATELDLMKSWNKRHGDKLMLYPSGLIQVDSQRMGDLWTSEGCPDGMD